MKFSKLVKYTVPVFAFAIICRSVEAISFIYYLVPILCVLFLISLLFDSSFKAPNKSKKQFPSKIIHHPLSFILLPGIWFLLTALWSEYPEISAARALFFILLSSGCVAAGILWSHHAGKNILGFLIPVNFLVVLICLFSLITDIPSDSWTGGNGKGFIGFFGHQNLLASIILFTVPSIINKIYQLIRNNKSNDSITNNYQLPTTNYLQLTAYCLLLTANLLFLTLTYSRASILSLVIGAIIFLIMNKNWKVLVSGFTLVAIFTLMILFIPTLNKQAGIIIKKDFPEFYSSRVWMWEPSYRAALNGGLIGLGYGISDPNEKVGGVGDHFENGRFIREKGNSVLALIEESGLIGLVLFIIPLIYVVRQFRIYNVEFRMKKNGDKNYTLYILYSALFAFLIHAQFEAWWVGVGSVQMPILFIYLGLAIKQKSSNGIKSY